MNIDLGQFDRPFPDFGIDRRRGAASHEAEVELAHAIEHGGLHANVKRWATEQREGRQLSTTQRL